MTGVSTSRSASRAVRDQARTLQRETGVPYNVARRTVSEGKPGAASASRTLIVGPRHSGRTRAAVALTKSLCASASTVFVVTLQEHRFEGLDVVFHATPDAALAKVEPGMAIVIDVHGTDPAPESLTLDGVSVVLTRQPYYMDEAEVAYQERPTRLGWEIRTLTLPDRAEAGPYFQYMRSDDPDVVAAIAQHAQDRKAFGPRAIALAEALGGQTPIAGHSMGQLRMSGVAAADKPDGRWSAMKRVDGLPDGVRGWRPYKNTDAAALMEALTVGAPWVPGLPDHFDAPAGRHGDTYWLSPSLVIHDGKAYLSLSMSPNRTQRNVRGTGGWVECLASEVENAIEAAKNEATES